MKLKIGLLAGITAVVMAFGVFGPGATTFAQEPPAAAEPDDALEHDFDFPHWLRRSIVGCAAHVLNLEVEQVRLALRNGHSLKEIGIRVGVRPIVLEHGILRCEAAVLARLVHAGELEPGEARRIFHWLETHITRIINFHWNPGDETLADPSPLDGA
jgi:hypothetical protein